MQALDPLPLAEEEAVQTPFDDGAPLLHKGVARDLGITIIDGAWAVEEVMTLEQIQHRFGISRTVAREVVRQLEGLGLVASKRRVGVQVQPRELWKVLSPTLIDWRLRSTDRVNQLRSLSQLRQVVEPAAAAGAAVHASVETRALLPPLAAAMRREGEAGRLQEFLELDIRLHRTLLASSGNELFAALGDVVEVVLRGRTELDLMPAQPAPAALEGHEAVAEAVWRGDPVAARDAMAGIISEVQEAFSITDG